VVATHSRHEEYEKAHAIWHSLQSDKAQREVLIATARADRRLPKKLVDHIKWITDRAGELATARNVAIHTPANFARIQGVGVIPIPTLSGKKSSSR
jgi:hypothetical protein